MKQEFEAIVLGVGGLGSAAAYWLSKRLGSAVLGLEQFDLGHVNGGSQDHSRIIRYSYHTPDYVRLAARAYDAWTEVEGEADRELIVRCGGLDLFPSDGNVELADYSESMNAAGVPCEVVASQAIRARWPQFRLDDSVQGIFQADGGYVKAAEANEIHQALAREHGARLLSGVTLEALREREGEYELITDSGTYSTGKLVITAGAWTDQILSGLDVDLPLQVTQEQVTYFHSSSEVEFGPDRFPVWIWNDDPCYYGFPCHPVDGIKVAEDLGGRPVTPESRSLEPDPENLSGVRRFCERYMPAAATCINYSKTCLYTLTPDRDFIVDGVPGHPGAWLAIGAGHAFKFASLIGKTLSELVIDGVTPTDIERFRADRPALEVIPETWGRPW